MSVVELVDLTTALASVLSDKSLSSHIIAIVALALNLICDIGEGSALALLVLRNRGNRAVADTGADSGAGIDNLSAAAILGFVEEESTSGNRGSSIDSVSAGAVRSSSAINNDISANTSERVAAWSSESLAEGERRIWDAASAVQGVNSTQTLI